MTCHRHDPFPGASDGTVPVSADGRRGQAQGRHHPLELDEVWWPFLVVYRRADRHTHCHPRVKARTEGSLWRRVSTGEASANGAADGSLRVLDGVLEGHLRAHFQTNAQATTRPDHNSSACGAHCPPREATVDPAGGLTCLRVNSLLCQARCAPPPQYESRLPVVSVLGGVACDWGLLPGLVLAVPLSCCCFLLWDRTGGGPECKGPNSVCGDGFGLPSALRPCSCFRRPRQGPDRRQGGPPGWSGGAKAGSAQEVLVVLVQPPSPCPCRGPGPARRRVVFGVALIWML